MWIRVYPDIARDAESVRFVCFRTRSHSLAKACRVLLLNCHGPDLSVRRQSLEYFLNTILQEGDHPITHGDIENF